MESIGYRIIGSLTSVLPQLLLIAGCIYYVVRKPAVDSVLLLLGSIMVMIVIVFNVMVVPTLIEEGSITPSEVGTIYAISGTFGMIGSILFAIGFFVLAHNMANAYNQLRKS